MAEQIAELYLINKSSTAQLRHVAMAKILVKSTLMVIVAVGFWIVYTTHIQHRVQRFQDLNPFAFTE